MNSSRELSWHERHFVALVVAGLPLLLLGWLVGAWSAKASHLLSTPNVGAVLEGGLRCAVIPVLLALFLPRKWLLLALAFVLGFSLAMYQVRTAGFAIGAWLELPLAALSPVTGEIRVAGEWWPPSNADLPWMVAIALWLSGLAALLRRGFQQRGWMRRWQAWMES